MADVQQLREARANLITEARSLNDSVTDQTTEADAKEVEVRFNEMMDEADKLQNKIETEERLSAAEASLDKRIERESGKEDRASNPEAETSAELNAEESFKRALQFGGEELRAQAAGTDSAGGYTVPEGFLNEITKTMALWGPMLNPGVTREISTASGNPLPWPTVNDTANVSSLVAENATVSEQDITFGEKILNAYKYSELVTVSKELLQDSAFEMGSLISELFGERIGRAANADLTVGTGSSQPNGIVTASTAGVTAASATAITADEIIDLQHSVDPAYRGSPSVRWMFNDNTFKQIRKLKDGDGNYLWQMGDVRANAPGNLLGSPYSVNQAMVDAATGTRPIVFGDFNKYIVRKVLDFSVQRLDELYAASGRVGFVGHARFDGELADTSAVKHMVMA